MSNLTLRVNGDDVTREVTPRTHLADFVRETLNLTGTHLGCEHGVCGACTLIVDGRPVRSCLTYAVSCGGADVRTIESFDDDAVMAQLRTAFSRHHALQCGYCTPGMLATAYDIVTRLPDADEARIREELSGNLCRCTGYVGIVAAIGAVLAEGPHQSAIATRERAVVSTGSLKGDRASAPAEAAAAAMAVPDQIDGGVTLTRSVPVRVPVEQLWRTLQDIETIARCLPGASIEKIDPDGTVAGACEVAIGPMRARFRGTARVTFDQISRSGHVRGAGGDSISRSRTDGAIRFAALAVGDAGSQLDLDMTYKLGGPLAQFGRPAVVASVVDRLLGDFVENLTRASEGHAVKAATPLGGIGFMVATVFDMIRGLFSPRRK